MKISYNWLRELTGLDWSPEEMAICTLDLMRMVFESLVKLLAAELAT